MINELKKSELCDFKRIGDKLGILVSLESLINIPFEMKRVYYIYNLKHDLPRGFHAHKNLQQLLVCVSGSCEVMLDSGNEKLTYHLNKPHQGLFIDKMIWHEMHSFSEDCVLMVLASDYYNEEDYIRNYENFIQLLS